MARNRRISERGESAIFTDYSSALRWGAQQLRGQASDLAFREAKWLLEAAAISAGRDPLFLLENGRITDRVRAVYRSLVARRSRGEPLAYVIGEASFMGFDLYVSPDVLIPRPETEGLVELALGMIPKDSEGRLLEQGTGSGAIATAIALARPRLSVIATEISESALSIASRNAARHGVENRVTFVLADLYPGIESIASTGGFDWIVANLPYVPDDAELPDDVREWEPKLALRGGKTGRSLVERSIESADQYLVRERHPSSGTFLHEIGEDQRDGFEAWLTRRRQLETSRLDSWEFRNDMTGRIRYLIGKVR